MMKNKMSRSPVTVIIPTLNEEIGIGSTMLELQMFLEDAHYLVVDGNSTDRTVKVARLLNAEVLHQDGKGKGGAIAQALKQVNSDTRYVVFIDADYTYPADNITKMINILDENLDVGMVIGNRFNSHLKLGAMGNIFYFGNRIIALLHSLLNGTNLRDPLTGLRVIRWEILKEWNPKSQGFDIEVELNYYFSKRLSRVVEIPIHYRERLGKKKLSLKHGFTIFKRIVHQFLA